MQGPIIKEILIHKPKNFEEWKNIPLVLLKYQDHEKIMGSQINAYWGEIQDLLDNVNWEK